MAKTEIKVKPTVAEVKKAYDKKRNKMSLALNPAMKKVSIMLDQWVQKNFQTEGGNVGGWKSIERDGKILQDTGVLRHSFIPFSSKNDAGIGSDLSYSKTHDKGLGKVSKRRILPMKKDVIAKARAIIKTTLTAASK